MSWLGIELGYPMSGSSAKWLEPPKNAVNELVLQNYSQQSLDDRLRILLSKVDVPAVENTIG